VQFIERTTCPGEAIGTGTVSPAAGTEVLDHLKFLLARFNTGDIDGIVFAPLNKQAMRQGGLPAGDELDFVIEQIGFSGNCGELNKLDDLWTSRVTSHIPLREVADAITTPRVLDAITLAADTLRAAGTAMPRIAVAGLNPHAGDGGTFGDEEIRVITPAIARARAAGIDAKGPFPCDTVFVAAKNRAFDAVVSMYHDQGQIAMKLMGFGRGVTVMGGLPVPIVTAGHGTAYDIVGRNIAKSDGLREAMRVCVAMAQARQPA
jgi:4-hydroxythreonine-4-phosphate dehydrogenase